MELSRIRARFKRRDGEVAAFRSEHRNLVVSLFPNALHFDIIYDVKNDINDLLKGGEGLSVEFKRCSGRIEHDTYETICAFLNRFGGTVLLGVEDDGTVVGVKGDAKALCNNIANVLNDPNVFDPVAYVDPKVVDVDGKSVICVHVAASPEVHRYKNIVYDRTADGDIKVRSNSDIAAMVIRKQGIYTERKIFPYVTKSDLRLDLLKRLRIRAQNNYTQGERHPWLDMDDDALLRSARLIGRDRATGEEGFNLAAVALLGSDEVIGDVFPVFGTDALLRVDNVERYDDRDIVCTNLIDSYDRLMAFARKHLPDPFYLESDQRISLREIIVREMVANTLIHREFTSSRPARFIIEKDKMFVENACRAAGGERITPGNLEPDPKNPIIAAFFREIGYADQLGSGVKNLYRYAKDFGGDDPVFAEGDMFRITVSLVGLARLGGRFGETNVGNSVGKAQFKAQNIERSALWNALCVEVPNLSDTVYQKYEQILLVLKADRRIKLSDVAARLGISERSVDGYVRILKKTALLAHVGSKSSGEWKVGNI